ncbi:antitoxin family protein [Thermococcus sp.]|uniref:antitoxin family protein n=1 Tax=Thermococcus sp. TaxID=35749 RepID=UPI002637B02D|nr:antitoxin family protein [Thermococcus sp.]
MGVVETIYGNGVFRPLKKPHLPKKRRVKLIILDEFIKDLNDAFGILGEDVDLEKLGKEWDRDVSS